MAKIRNAEKDVEQQRSSYIANGNAKWNSHFRRQLASYKTKFTLIIQSNNYTPWCLLKGVEDLHPQIIWRWICVFYICPNLYTVWRRKWQPIPVFLPGECHGQRSLVDCSPWGPYEWDRTERLHFHFSLSFIEEGNDSPLQHSCLPGKSHGWGNLVGCHLWGCTESDTTSQLSSSSSIDCIIPRLNPTVNCAFAAA